MLIDVLVIHYTFFFFFLKFNLIIFGSIYNCLKHFASRQTMETSNLVSTRPLHPKPLTTFSRLFDWDALILTTSFG